MNIFDPMTLPIASAFDPLMEAETLTTVSGMLVPTATMVSPITTFGIFSRLAILSAVDFLETDYTHMFKQDLESDQHQYYPARQLRF